MTTTVHSVSPGVWTACRSLTAPAARVHPANLDTAHGMPGWRRREFLSGRALLRVLLKATAPEAHDAPVVREHRGRPSIEGRPDLGISVSHDDDTVAVAVAVGRRVGVDVQHPVASLTPRLAAWLLRPQDPATPARSVERSAIEIAWTWTVREACVKAAGLGLAGRPWRIQVPPYSTTGTWGPFRWVSLRDRSGTPLSCAFEYSSEADEQGVRNEDDL